MVWDESKHPRDKDGRFTHSGLSLEETKNMSVEELRKHLIRSNNNDKKIPLDFFSKKEKQIRKYNSESIPEMPREAYGFARLHTNHHERHAAEMGYKDMKEYERAAINFWNKGEGELYYSKPRCSYYKYNRKTTELVIVSDGTIHSFMYKSARNFLITERWDKLERI